MVGRATIVKYMLNYSPTLDSVFQALGDSTRRAVVEQLSAGPMSTSALAAPHEMSLPGFTQHLAVLANTGLIASQKHGRVRTYHLVADTMARGEDWFTVQRDSWSQRLDQLDALLTTPTKM